MSLFEKSSAKTFLRGLCEHISPTNQNLHKYFITKAQKKQYLCFSKMNFNIYLANDVYFLFAYTEIEGCATFKHSRKVKTSMYTEDDTMTPIEHSAKHILAYTLSGSHGIIFSIH